MISSFIDSCHETWDRYLQHFAFALRTAVHDSTGKTPAELFLGRKIITPFEKLIMVKDMENKFMVQKIEKLIEEVKRKVNAAKQAQAKYYNLKRRVLEVKVGDFVLLETHFLSNKAGKFVKKFGPKFVGPYRVKEVKENNLVLDVEGRTMVVNVDQVRVYKFREDIGSSASGTPGEAVSSLHDSFSPSNFQSIEQQPPSTGSSRPVHTKSVSNQSTPQPRGSPQRKQHGNVESRQADCTRRTRSRRITSSSTNTSISDAPRHKPPSRTHPLRPAQMTPVPVAPKRSHPSTTTSHAHIEKFQRGPDITLPRQRSAGQRQQRTRQQRRQPVPVPAKRRHPTTTSGGHDGKRPRRVPAPAQPVPGQQKRSHPPSSTEGHLDKVLRGDDIRRRLRPRPRPSTTTGVSRFSSNDERKFVESFWNTERHKEDSMIPDSSSDSL